MNSLLHILASNKARLMVAAIAAASTVAPPLTQSLYRESVQIMAAERQLLKMDWSGPEVFCTEFSISYDSKTNSCGKHGPIAHGFYGPSGARSR